MTDMIGTPQYSDRIRQLEPSDQGQPESWNPQLKKLIDNDAYLKEQSDTHQNSTAPHGATSAATPSRIILRDANGRAKVAAPEAADDIARKETVDNHANLTGPHGSTSSATPSRIILRDANGRAQVAAPVADEDIARKQETDAAASAGEAAAASVQGNLDAHLADNTHHVPHLGTTTNSGNNYSITSTKDVSDGKKFSVKFNAAASGAATLNVSSDGSARALKKPGGTDFLPKAGVYTFFRDDVNFQLLGEGGEYGTAGAAQTLEGYSIGTESGLVDGTMPNNAGDVACLASSVSGTTLKLRAAQGYTDGVDDNVTITDANFTEANIKEGITMLNKLGTLVPQKRNSGSTSASSNKVVVTSLSYTPRKIMVKKQGSTDGQREIFYNYYWSATKFIRTNGGTTSIATDNDGDWDIYANGFSVYVGETGTFDWWVDG